MKSNRLRLKTGALIAALALVFGIAAIPAVSAGANSVQKDWYGSASSGMLVTDENCPVIVESETLTFDIQTFPANYYYEQEEFDAYDAKVTAHYNFYNPADYEVNMTLVFPFGEYTSYLGEHIDESGKYLVTAGGERIESSVRHTLSYGEFNAERDVAKILDGYKEDEFYSPDMPVHYYTCRFSGFDGTKGVYVKLDYDKSNTRVFYSVAGAQFDETPYVLLPYEGGADPVSYVKNGSVIYLFVIGKDAEPEFSFNQSWPLFGDDIADKINVTERDITFKDVMLVYYDEYYGVSETDWYNAAIEYLDRYGCLDFVMSNSLMRWFEYRLTIPAGGRLVNEVTAPLYPNINGNYSSAVYEYRYLLSPAKCWAGFGSLDITVNTPYYITGCPLGDFEKVEGGYSLHFDGLPDGELTFTMCQEQYYYRTSGVLSDIAVVILIVVCSVIFGLQVIVAIPLTIVFAVTGKFSSKSKP